MVYKYRNKKDKLWKVLETKYGISVTDDYSHLDEKGDIIELDEDEEKEL